MARVSVRTIALLVIALAHPMKGAEPPQNRSMPARWAGLIGPEQYRRIISLVEADIRARKLTPIVTAESSLKIREEPFAGSTFGLDNLVHKCRLVHKDKWPGVVREHFDHLIQSVEEDARLARRLEKPQTALPLLAVRLYGEASVPAEAKKDLVWRSDIEGTLTVLVLDLPTSLRSVTSEQARGWGVKESALFERALSNASKNVPVETVRDALPGGAKLVALAGESLLASSHALLLRDHPQAVGKGGALVGIPTRHIVLCHPIDDASASRAMEPLARMIINLHREGPGSTSDKLYWYRDGQFSVIPMRVDARGVTVEPPEELAAEIRRLAR